MVAVDDFIDVGNACPPVHILFCLLSIYRFIYIDRKREEKRYRCTLKSKSLFGHI